MDQLILPNHSSVIHKEECTLCFDNQDSDNGINLCLTCFDGACPTESINQHSNLHHSKTGHSIFVNIKRRRRPLAASKRDDIPPLKKLAIRADVPEEEKYEIITVGKRYVGVSGESETIQDGGDKLIDVISAVLASQSSAQKSEVKAWEEEIIDCVHTREAVQLEGIKVGTTCSHPDCGLTSPLWLCLVCGSLGCGRKQFGGTVGGGQGHGVEHYERTGHSIAVKLGTIEIGGTGDVYCYPCDDARIDPHLSKHLAHFGIDVGEMKKTEKSMTELQIEQNLKFDFAMTGVDGKDLQPVFGPGLTGLKNLGNSCYLASTVQSIFALPAFQSHYLESFKSHPKLCINSSPANCIECQMAKMADGLLSGRYSVVESREEGSGFVRIASDDGTETSDATLQHHERPNFQLGLKPTMFKALVGKDHIEFSTMKQQDADEFLKHLLKIIRQSIRTSKNNADNQDDPTRQFSFTNETRLQCGDCRGVRYGTEEQESITIPVPAVQITRSVHDIVDNVKEGKKVEYESIALETCLESLMSTVEVDYHCLVCVKNVTAYKTNRFATFPAVLTIHASRFQYINWVPTKVEVPLLVSSLELSLDQFIGLGKREDEVELPIDVLPSTNSGFQFNIDSVAKLVDMGFSEIRCQRGLLATGNGGVEEAMNWLFEHMDDPDIDKPLSAAQPAALAEPTPEQIDMVMEMGFSVPQSRRALRETNCDISRAIEWLFSHPDDQGDDDRPYEATNCVAPSLVYGSATLPAKYRLKSFISHKGPSVHSGHYVSHIRSSSEGSIDQWTLFNDEKVVKAEEIDDLIKFGYVYIFERV